MDNRFFRIRETYRGKTTMKTLYHGRDRKHRATFDRATLPANASPCIAPLKYQRALLELCPALRQAQVEQVWVIPPFVAGVYVMAYEDGQIYRVTHSTKDNHGHYVVTC